MGRHRLRLRSSFRSWRICSGEAAERTDKSMEMTIPEEEIVDIVSRALRQKSKRVESMSLLKGYDVPEIDALKLSIANKFLYLSGDPASENRFREFVRAASAVSFAIPRFCAGRATRRTGQVPVGSQYMREDED